MKERNVHLRLVAALCFCCLSLSLLWAALHASAASAVSAASAEAPVSPGLCVLAEESPMAMAALCGSPITFEKSDFARAMNLSSVRSVTVTKAPSPSEGELRLGNVILTGGQTVSGSNLSNLSFVSAKSGVSTGSFRFTVNGSPVEMTCQLYLLEQVNEAPTLSMVPKTALTVSTHQNITLYGELPSYDPDGDLTTVEIVSYPKSGILILTDRQSGSYTYTPTAGKVGKDSFTYVVRDPYGNYSASATVSLQIVKPSVSVVYDDLQGHSGYNAALSVTEAGLMQGTMSGHATYFEPEGSVSRGEFLVLAMKAMGIDDPGTGDASVFADHADLSDEERNYVAAAYRLGYIKGEESGGELCFFPDRAITRAEAAVILGRMLDASAPTVKPVFSDSEDIPTFAQASLEAMTYLGILDDKEGKAAPRAAVTRIEAAEILCALMVHCEA